MLERGDLFLGNITPRHRPYLCKLLQHFHGAYERFHIPACGKFAAAEVARAAGWPAAAIHTSDVAILSACIAAYINGHGTESYGPITASGDLGALDLARPEYVLYALKLAVMRQQANQYYKTALAREVERDPARHIASIKKGLDELRDKLAGIHYRQLDLFRHLEEVCDDPKAIVYINPPAYKGGYEKMYDHGGALQRPEPDFQWFDPKGGHERLREMMRGKKALIIRSMYHKFHDDAERAEVILADGSQAVKRDGVFESLLSNRPEECAAAFRRTVIVKPALRCRPYPAPILAEEHEITAQSSVRWVKVEREVSMYYRDLWAHRLGVTDSRDHLLLLIDGYVVGIVGTMSDDVNRGRQTIDGELWIFETYGFNCASTRYARLNRLLMMLITCRDFEKQVADKNVLHKSVGLATTCLTQYPELKTNRGIMELKRRDDWKNGMYKLLYIARWREETYAEALSAWLAKHGHIRSSTSARGSSSGESTLTT